MKKDKLTPQEQTTINYYDTNAHDWSNRHGLTGLESFFSESMGDFFKFLSKGKILEIGSGHGGEAIELIKHYGIENYIGIDASKGLLKIAKSRNPGAKFLNRNIYDLGFPKNSFDGFWVSAMLIHIPKNRLHEALLNLSKVTKKRGVGFISILEGNLDMDESRPGRFFTLWEKEEFNKELKRAGFSILKQGVVSNPGQNPWLVYIIQK